MQRHTCVRTSGNRGMRPSIHTYMHAVIDANTSLSLSHQSVRTSLASVSQYLLYVNINAHTGQQRHIIGIHLHCSLLQETIMAMPHTNLNTITSQMWKDSLFCIYCWSGIANMRCMEQNDVHLNYNYLLTFNMW